MVDQNLQWNIFLPEQFPFRQNVVCAITSTILAFLPPCPSPCFIPTQIIAKVNARPPSVFVSRLPFPQKHTHTHTQVVTVKIIRRSSSPHSRLQQIRRNTPRGFFLGFFPCPSKQEDIWFRINAITFHHAPQNKRN